MQNGYSVDFIIFTVSLKSRIFDLKSAVLVIVWHSRKLMVLIFEKQHWSRGEVTKFLLIIVQFLRIGTTWSSTSKTALTKHQISGVSLEKDIRRHLFRRLICP